MYGDGLPKLLEDSLNMLIKNSALIFSYTVSNPSKYGIVSEKNKIVSLIEKPKFSISKEAVIGLYIYPNIVTKLAM